MAIYRVSEAANRRLDEIYTFTRDRWGEDQARSSIEGLFNGFEAIAREDVLWRSIPTEFEVDGYFRRYEHHFIYWRRLKDGDAGIVTILHERMHRIDRFKRDWD